ncbi:MAG: exonuclease SbcCD subunit D [Armatimonadetes bacterium]|nr:exonuclease SbcCD subunit D [Armatimonadota bacterium]MCX7777890.1 exonuclease SbcCD subunit D [Armatimonadota bacterium]
MAMRILHFADAHIGIETHGKLDPASGLNTRLLDFVRCLEYIVDAAIERQVDVVLFAGDAYDYANPTPTYQKLFGAQMKRLSDAGIPTVLIVGNHDMPVSYGKASPLELFGVLGVPNIHVAVKPQVINVTTRSGVLQVACLPYPNRSALLTREEVRAMSEEEIAKRIEGICSDCISSMAERLSHDAPSVLLAHVAAWNAVYAGSERTAELSTEPKLMLSALAMPQFKYVALGHIHKYQDLNPSGAPHVVYSGSIDRCDFAEENEQKGFCVVSIADGVELEFLETPARRFVTIDVNMHGLKNPTQALINAIMERNVKDAIVRIRYSCTDEQQTTIDWKAVEQALSGAFRVVSVARQVEKPLQRPQAVITEQMSTIEALRRYIRHKSELKELEDELIRYAQQLESELIRESAT